MGVFCAHIEQVWLTVKSCFTAQYVLKFCIMINYDWRPANQPLMCPLICQSYLHVLQLRLPLKEG